MIDFSQVKGREAIDNGEYPVILTDFEYVPSTQSGNPGVKFTFTFNDAENEGRKLPQTKSLQPQAMWVVKLWLGVLGASDQEINTPRTPAEFDAWGKERLIGQEARAVISKTQYKSREFDADGQPILRDGNQIDRLLSAY